MWSRRNFFSVLGSLGFLGVASSSETETQEWKIGDWQLMSCAPPCDYGRITTGHHHWMRLKEVIPWPHLDNAEMEIWEEPNSPTRHRVFSPRWKKNSFPSS